MDQTVAIVLPLPVAVALVFLLMVLLALSAVALSLHTPPPIRLPSPDGILPVDHARSEDGSAFPIVNRHLDGPAELSSPPRRLL